MSAVMEAVSRDGLVVPAASPPETMLQSVRELAELAAFKDRRACRALHQHADAGAGEDGVEGIHGVLSAPKPTCASRPPRRIKTNGRATFPCEYPQPGPRCQGAVQT